MPAHQLTHTRRIPLQILGTGLYEPPEVQTAEALAPLLGCSPDWIRDHTGVGERRISRLPMQQMAAHAVREALGADGPPDMLINASITPVQLIPDSSVFILRELGLSGIPAMSLHASCLSFLNAIPVVAGLLHTGVQRRIVVVSAEKGSTARNFAERESAALLGDGAAAVVFGCESGGGALLGWAMGTWPEGAEMAQIRGFGDANHPLAASTVDSDHRFSMQGPRMFKMAMRRVPGLVFQLLDDLDLTPEDIDVVVPHQASGPGLRLLPRMGFPDEKIVRTVDVWGNCIAASIPMALAAAHRQGRLTSGKKVLLLGTGAGLSVGAVVLEC